MKKFQTITSLVAVGAIIATPTLAFARNGGDMIVNAGGESHVSVDLKQGFGLYSKEREADKSARLETQGKAHATTTSVKAEGSIDARLEKLTKLEERIGDLSRLTAEQKATLSSVITAQINSLTALKARLASSTATTNDKIELAKSNRISALVMPQVAITAASNRVLAIVAQMEAFAPKLQARIANSTAPAADIAAAQAAYTEMLAEVANAKILAQGAASTTVNLKADNGDQSVFKANQQVLKDARAKLKEAHESLHDARKDIMTILKVLNVKGEVTASTTVKFNR